MLHYTVAKTTQRVGKDKGKIKYYAQRDVRSTLTLRQVEDQIVQKTSLARGDVRNAIASLAEVVNDALLSGLKVDLGDLGSFGVEANGRMMATEEEVTAKSIKKPQIRYNPKVAMRKYAQEVAINVHRPNDANPRAVGAVGLCYAIGWRASRLEGCGGATSPHIRANKGESFFLCASLIIPFRGLHEVPKKEL